MSDNIYDILNDNTIDLEELDKEGFSDIEKKKIMNYFKKSVNKNKSKNKKKGLIAAAIIGMIAVGTLGSGYGNSVAAAIKLASADIGSFLGINKNLDAYKTVVGLTKSSDGVSIQLNEVVLNGNELVVSTTTKYEKDDVKVESIHPFGEIFVNGKRMSESSGGTGKPTQNSEFQEVMTYQLKNDELKGDLDIKIVYSSILLNGEEVKIKPCIFEFTTNGDELAVDTVEIPINHSFTLENGSIVTLNKYVSNVIDKKIYLAIENVNKSKTIYDIELRGHDNCGNEIVFETSKMNEKGGVLKLSKVLGEEISDKASEITLTPYAVAYPEKSGKLSSNYKQVGEEFTIKIK